MAERRMISKKIVDTDLFLDMPMSSRYLYYELNWRADDDGFVASPKKITKMVGCSDNDLGMLVMKHFIIPFESGICVIKDWRIHNYIQKDRYHETQYVDEKSKLEVSKRNSYELKPAEMDAKCIQPVSNLSPEVRLELGKDRVRDRDRGTGEETPVPPATELPPKKKDFYELSLYEQVRIRFIENCPSLPKPNHANEWTPARKKAIRDKKITADEFIAVFKKVEQSDFLTGRKTDWHGCSFDWILKPANWQKINEGNYDNRVESSKKPEREYTFDIDAYERDSLHDVERALKRDREEDK